MTTAKWWSAVDPVTVEVTCGEERHRLSWRRGKLVLEDHDVAAEESFAALGGEPALCLEVLRAWRAGIDDHRVLWFWDAARTADPDMALMIARMRAQQQQLLAQPSARRPVARMPGPPSPGPPLPPGPPGPQPVARRQSPQRLVVTRGGRQIVTGGTVPPQLLERMRADMASEFRRSLLSALPEELRLRLGLSAIVRADRRRADRFWFGTRVADLESALAGRARPAFEACMRSWRGRVANLRLPIECWIAGPGEEPAVCGLMDDAGAWAGVRLPLRWLVDVWARGAAVVDGCFVLGVDEADASGTRLAVTAVRWERRLPAGSTPVLEPAIVLKGEDGEWRLRWAG